MRQYRGKRIDNGEWVKGDLITEKDTNGVITRAFIHLRLSPIEFNGDSLSSRIVLHEVDPKTVGQCAGLKVNDKDLCEGDILLSPEGVKGKIKYVVEHAAFLAYWKHNGTCGYDHLESDGILKECEIISNIHDTVVK